MHKAIPIGFCIIVTLACSLLNPSPDGALKNGTVPKGDIVVWNLALLDGPYPVTADGVARLYSTTRPLSIRMSFSQMTAEISNGKIIRYVPSSAPLEVEYQLCYSTGEICEPQGQKWKSDNEVKIGELNLDWSSVKKLTFRSRFREVDQKPVLSLNWDSVFDQVEITPTEVSEINFIIDIVEQAEPETPTPLPPLSITETYAATMSPVQGSIEIAPETSVIGGTAGSTRQVPVIFTAASTLGKITEMRVDDGEWEAFVPQKEYPITIPLNWSTVQFCVEYRDEIGNISPRYCDSKAAEGNPQQNP